MSFLGLVFLIRVTDMRSARKVLVFISAALDVCRALFGLLKRDNLIVLCLYTM